MTLPELMPWGRPIPPRMKTGEFKTDQETPSLELEIVIYPVLKLRACGGLTTLVPAVSRKLISATTALLLSWRAS